MSSTPLLKDRRDLIEFYEVVCARGYAKLRYDRRLEPEQNLLKSYLVEVHPSLGVADADERLRFLRGLVASVNAEAHPSMDDTLFNVQRGADIFHVDALHDRYWVFHSNAHASATDRFIDDLTRGTTSLDVAWFPSQAMEALASVGEFLGFASEYDPRPIFPLEEEAADEHVDGLVISVRRFVGDATADLDKLRRPGMFRDEIGLSTVRLRFGDGATGEEGLFALADITHSGKFTARGPSFSAHQALIRRATRMYEDAIASIERDLAIRWEQLDGGYRVTGVPVGIDFRPYKRFDLLVKRMFDGRRPFRLWGLAVPSGQEEYRAHAVDLHVGSELTLDVANGFIRVYLSEGACGNTITRLFTNIQRHIDSRAVLMLGERTRAFGFAS